MIQPGEIIRLIDEGKLHEYLDGVLATIDQAYGRVVTLPVIRATVQHLITRLDDLADDPQPILDEIIKGLKKYE